MSNIKNFETPADYQSFKGSDEMVKPNVSYVKETNEIHYNPRFAIKFEPGNYYVEEANYLKEIHDSIYNITQNTDSYYINEYGDVYTNWGNNYSTNISEESYFSYLKKIILLDKKHDGFIILSDGVLNTNTVYVMYNEYEPDDWGYCDYLEA
jgi:hypothetical protein